MGALMVLPPVPDMTDVESGASWLADSVTRKLVGMAIPSDVHRGKWRAGVVTRKGNLEFVCVQGSSESLVELTQVGTETFNSMRDAMRAVARNRQL